MKLIISIMWLCGGIVWTMNASREMNNVWYWIFAILSFAVCFAYANAYDKQRKQ